MMTNMIKVACIAETKKKVNAFFSNTRNCMYQFVPKVHFSQNENLIKLINRNKLFMIKC